MNINEVREIVSSAFSSAGFTKGSYTIHLPSPTIVHIYGDENSVQIVFDRNTLPTASVKKILKLTVSLEEIYVSSRGGKIKLRHFPDINFKFDEAEEDEADVSIFGSAHVCHPAEACASLLSEVDAKYGGDACRRKLARKVLQYAQAWATMNVDSGVCFVGLDSNQQRDAKNSCIDFVKEQMKNDDDATHGSIIVVFLIQLILPYIIKWVVERVIDRLING